MDFKVLNYLYFYNILNDGFISIKVTNLDGMREIFNLKQYEEVHVPLVQKSTQRTTDRAE